MSASLDWIWTVLINDAFLGLFTEQALITTVSLVSFQDMQQYVSNTAEVSWTQTYFYQLIYLFLQAKLPLGLSGTLSEW